MASTKTATSVLQAFLDAFNAHDVDAIMSFFAEDCVLDMPRGPAPGGRRLVGRDQVREGIQSRLDGIPDVHYGDDRHWICGDRAVPSGRSAARSEQASPSRSAGAIYSSSSTARSAGRIPSGRSSTDRLPFSVRKRKR